MGWGIPAVWSPGAACFGENMENVVRKKHISIHFTGGLYMFISFWIQFRGYEVTSTMTYGEVVSLHPLRRVSSSTLQP